jgi:Zn-dependent oligopeptidase
MELWMTQRSTLYALIDMSNSVTPLSDEWIDAAYRVKAREKVMKLSELTLYGTLELELFSTFDIQGNETILALQERLTGTIMPHIEYDKTDMTVLLDIIEDNVNGQHVAWYRYLWCEVHAAALMEHLVHKMSSSSSSSSDIESISQIRLLLRQNILEPGANINYTTFQTKLGIGDVTLEPLWKLHGLSNVDKILPETLE